MATEPISAAAARRRAFRVVLGMHDFIDGRMCIRHGSPGRGRPARRGHRGRRVSAPCAGPQPGRPASDHQLRPCRMAGARTRSGRSRRRRLLYLPSRGAVACAPVRPRAGRGRRHSGSGPDAGVGGVEPARAHTRCCIIDRRSRPMARATRRRPSGIVDGSVHPAVASRTIDAAATARRDRRGPRRLAGTAIETAFTIGVGVASYLWLARGELRWLAGRLGRPND